MLQVLLYLQKVHRHIIIKMGIIHFLFAKVILRVLLYKQK